MLDNNFIYINITKIAMKFLPWGGQYLRFYNRWLKKLGNTIGVRERPKIYNLGACFELDELVSEQPTLFNCPIIPESELIRSIVVT